MLATRDDVAECYRVFLLREPENELVVDRQLEQSPRLIDVVKNVVASNEYKSKILSRPHATLNKCFDGEYLFKDLPGAERVRSFLHHYGFLSSALDPGCFQEILFNGKTVFARSTENEYVAELRVPSAIINEGELSLTFRMDGKRLCDLSFSFVPSGFLFREAPSGLLITRFQGAANTKDQARRAVKDMGNMEPKAVLFSCLVGIAEASDVEIIAGVPARLQVCYGPEHEETFTNAYDRFFEAAGLTQTPSGFFVAPMPLTAKPLSLVDVTHRRRAMKRREARAKIALAAKEAWTSWAPLAPEPRTEPVPPRRIGSPISNALSRLRRLFSLNTIPKSGAPRKPSLGGS